MYALIKGMCLHVLGGTNPLEGAALGMSLLECFAEAGAFYRDMLEGVFRHGVKIDAFEQDRENMLPSCRKRSSNVISNKYITLDDALHGCWSKYVCEGSCRWYIPSCGKCSLCSLDLPDGRPFNVELKSISTLEMTMVLTLLKDVPFGHLNAINIAERLELPNVVVGNVRKLNGTASAEINESTPVRVEFGDATAATDPTGANAIARPFPHTYGQPLAHFSEKNLKQPMLRLSMSTLRAHCLDFWETLDMIDDVLATYKNLGGYDLLGRTKDQIRTTEQVNSAMAACKALNLDGIDIVEGVTSNTDTTQLDETFAEAKCATMVVGVPVTLNGDLKNHNVCTDAFSAEKYYYFIRIMSRKASHVAVECTLQSHPNMLPIPTHPALLPDLIVGLDRCLQYYTSKAKSGCGSRNTFILAMLTLPRCAAYTKFHGVFKKKEKPTNLQRRNSQVARTKRNDNAFGVPQLCVHINTLKQICTELEVLEKRIITLLRNSESAHVSDFSNGLSKKFELTLDQIPLFSTKVSIRSVETQLGAPISQLFANISPEPMAIASLGQVYRAHLHTRELVVVKVQRPGICLKKLITSLRDRILSGLLLCMVSVTDFEESKLKDYVEMTKDFV
uniref:Pyrophosphate--fructose 6-phosphate 1-phosphotransferase subunit alpha n=1 Tax=Tanacetum cinerariifolium TaxID=118510 RepID=A0A6L2JQK9_TANCI|nr:pyrophosphate--fructose 6-phosphate 1-phosphotransferase subunit alpha [Tanacetum cinerariifolium]